MKKINKWSYKDVRDLIGDCKTRKWFGRRKSTCPCFRRRFAKREKEKIESLA